VKLNAPASWRFCRFPRKFKLVVNYTLMPKLTGLFDHFPKLNTVTADMVTAWLGGKADAKLLENRLGNRILYPSAIPCSAEDINFDLVILREAVKTQPQDFINQNLRLIYIPEEFGQFFPDLRTLAVAFVDALKPRGITSIVLKSATLGLKNLGSVIKPEVISPSGTILIRIHDQKYEVAESGKVDINFQSRAAKLLGKDNATLEVAGGKLGLLVDTRG